MTTVKKQFAIMNTVTNRFPAIAKGCYFEFDSPPTRVQFSREQDAENHMVTLQKEHKRLRRETTPPQKLTLVAISYDIVNSRKGKRP